MQTLLTQSSCAMWMTLAAVLTLPGPQPLQADDWPGWRGPNRDAKSTETGLLKQWPADGPEIAWQVDNAGVGYSSLVVKDGRVITQGDLDGIEHIICFREEDGKLLWAVQPEPVARALTERVESQFAKFDRNNDGKLDQLESLAAFGWNLNRFDVAEEGADAEAIAEKRTAELLQQFDTNNDGRLDGSEVPNALQREMRSIDKNDPKADKEQLARARADAALKTADEDKDGKISRKESRNTSLRRIFNRADQKKPGERRGDGFLTSEELYDYFLKREPGQDGAISKNELQQHLVRQHPGVDGVMTQQDLRRVYGGYRNGRGDGPRGTPTIDGERVYALGGNGDLTCLDLRTGETLWHVNLSQDLGGGRPGWGYSESPLIVGELVIVTPGGKQGTLAALDKSDGTVMWRSAAVTQRAHYSSPIVAELAGVKQIIQFGRESVFGVSMDGRHLLWSYKEPANGTANCATPIVGDNHVLASSAYGTGTGCVKISGGANQQTAEEVYFQKRLANHHGGLVKVGDYVYGFGSGLMCIDFKTGEIQWRARSVRKGSLVYADGMLYCLGERQDVALVEANPEKYVEKGRFRIEPSGKPSWAHPVVAGGRLYIRDQNRLTAYNIKGTDSKSTGGSN